MIKAKAEEVAKSLGETNFKHQVGGGRKSEKGMV